jgi:hypothetical protein
MAQCSTCRESFRNPHVVYAYCVLDCSAADCGPYGCSDDDTCKVQCDTDGDCDLSASCVQGKCVRGRACAEGCGNFACNGAEDHCNLRCNFRSDCADGLLCDPDGQCVPA